MLTARNIFYDYPDRPVLHGVSLTLSPGEVLAVLGPNGAGKSTLLRCLAGALSPRGQIELDGRPLLSVPPGERARLLAFVPQHIPPRLPMTVFEAVLLGRRPYLSWRPRPQDLEAVWEGLSLLGLEDLAQREFSEISGGQRQKAALARALAQESRLLVMDEPTSSLDLRHQLEVMTLLCAQAERRDTGVILAVHDLNLAARFAHRAILLHEGRVEADGPPSEVLTEESIRRVYGVEVLRLKAGAETMFFPLSAASGTA
ncbi:iron complex transport system ATP-binding protein [Humidesulfovibrio mexicanus]|uniref:Iron complex transport system ATP-binding protein n=1 Tax=Humidesulfovibrio mexicanus TaxID=147047 RepID=A0A239A3M4_9BACT|nr:ABC transporter ATP-binding protein [Humidesulfovibrio mexicanus]SNR90235.1 iron complex transport system ATP-binding protein [Humidesulfovibrio mexicanus]